MKFKILSVIYIKQVAATTTTLHLQHGSQHTRLLSAIIFTKERQGGDTEVFFSAFSIIEKTTSGLS